MSDLIDIVMRIEDRLTKLESAFNLLVNRLNQERIDKINAERAQAECRGYR